MATQQLFLVGPAMALIFTVVTILIIHSQLSSATSDLPMDPGVSSNATTGLYSHATLSEHECKKGSISKCPVLGSAEEDDETELSMDLEMKRRVLAGAWYISYGALWRNVVPCSRRGVSYYSCRSGTEANPYTRGCSQITRCRG